MASPELKEAIRPLARLGRSASSEAPPLDMAPGCAFGAGVVERIKAIEQGLTEVKGRLNGLILVVLGAVVTEFILRLVT